MIIRTRTGDCIVAGRLSRDAEFSNVGAKNLPLTKFSIPARDTVQPGGSKQTEWISCEVWYEAAMNAAQLKKGDAVIICGQLSTHSYTTRNGETRTEECLRADAFVKASVPVSSASVEQLAAAYPGVVHGVGVVADDFTNEPKLEELPEDESDLPF